jgi:TPR repeat protein
MNIFELTNLLNETLKGKYLFFESPNLQNYITSPANLIHIYEFLIKYAENKFITYFLYKLYTISKNDYIINILIKILDKNESSIYYLYCLYAINDSIELINKYLDIEIEKKNPYAYYTAGWKYKAISDKDTLQTYEKSINYFELYIEKEHEYYYYAIKQIRELLENDTIETNICGIKKVYYNQKEKMFKYLLLAAENNIDMTIEIGEYYLLGKEKYSIEKNNNTAFKYYNKAFQMSIKNEEHYANVYSSLAKCYKYGYGTIINYTKAFEYYIKTIEICLDEKIECCDEYYELATLYHNGFGIERDTLKAFYYYGIAMDEAKCSLKYNSNIYIEKYNEFLKECCDKLFETVMEIKILIK